MRVLVIGGNRYFGKRLARNLQAVGDRVTLMNRGQVADGLSGDFERLICDRRDSVQLTQVVGDRRWDIVFDQVCYDARDAQIACKVFAGKTGRYVFTSTQSVYGPGSNILESTFGPEGYNEDGWMSKVENYAESKRRAEGVFHQQKSLKVLSVRIPIIVGEDDYTGRLLFHVQRILKGEPIHYPNLKARLSMLDSEDAAQGLALLAKSDLNGQVNFAAPSPISIEDFVAAVELATGVRAVLAPEESSEKNSPYGIEADWWMNTERARAHGIQARQIGEWLVPTVRSLIPINSKPQSKL